MAQTSGHENRKRFRISTRKRAEAVLAERTRQMEAVRTITTEIAQELDLTHVLELITQRAVDLVGADQGSILLWDDSEQILVPKAWSGVLAGRDVPSLRLGEGVAGTAALRREGLMVNDFPASPYATPRTTQLISVSAVLSEPLLYRNRLVGVITVSRDAPKDAFTDEHQKLLRLFATQAAIAIENAGLHEAAVRRGAELEKLPNSISAQAAIAIENARLFQQEQTRRMQLEAICAVTVEIARELDLTALLQLIIERATHLVGANLGTILLWNEAEQLLVPCAWLGYGEWRRDMRFRLGEGIVGEIAARRAGIIANDYPTKPFAHAGTLARMQITAAMGEPLLYRDRLIGVLTVDYTQPGQSFTPRDQELLRLFATQAAIAIENAGLHEAAVRRGAELETLLAATRSVMSGLDLQEILDRIVAEAHRISGAPHVKIVLLDRPAGVLRVGATRGTAHLPGETLPLDSGLSALVARSGEPLYVPQCAEDPRNRKAARDRALGMQAYLGLPITRGTEVLGVLTFNTVTPKGFSPAEMAYLTSFAAQAAIAIENARLFAELQDSYARLQAAQEELVRSEKFRGLGQMAAGIAHDLNNTLAAILGQVELMQLRGVPPDILDHLNTLETAASDGAHVVRRLQDFARQRGSSPLTPMTLGQVVQEALDLTAPRWKDEVQRRGHTIHVHVALDGLPPIQGHAPEIREALTNLIFNAVDAMPEGGVLTFTGTATPDGVFLHVGDTGVGMPEAVRQKVFEPFFTTKGVKGTGLGLSVVYGIMERHGGRAAVTTLPGKGTTVTLQFQTALTAPNETAPDGPPARTTSRRILVIDDDPVIRRTMTELLRTAGHTLLAAESGPAGMAYLAHTLPDLVLTDLGMPEMSGVDVARRVKAAHPRLPVVLLTGWGDTATLSAEDRQVVDRVLGKPIRLAELLQVVAELTGTEETVSL